MEQGSSDSWGPHVLVSLVRPLSSVGRAGGDVPEKQSGPFSLWNATCLSVSGGVEHVLSPFRRVA